MTDDRTTIPLILLAQAGDRQALGELLRLAQEPLHRYLYRLVADRHLADDVLQDVFVLVWRKLPWLRDPALFRPWLYRIASREAFRRLRRERLWAVHATDADLAALAQPVEPPEPAVLATLPDQVASLSPASRAVLLLHYAQGLTLDEIAAALEVPPGTVKSRLAYGLAALRQRLTPTEEPDDRA